MTFKEINKKYEFMNDVYFEHQEGWAGIIDKMCSALNHFFELSKNNYGFKILQIKEKFGVLVIYYCITEDCSDEVKYIIDAIIKAAEIKSRGTCERCGKYGYLRRDSSWIHTYCDDCEKKTKRRKDVNYGSKKT